MISDQVSYWSIYKGYDGCQDYNENIINYNETINYNENTLGTFQNGKLDLVDVA